MRGEGGAEVGWKGGGYGGREGGGELGWKG